MAVEGGLGFFNLGHSRCAHDTVVSRYGHLPGWPLNLSALPQEEKGFVYSWPSIPALVRTNM